MNISILAICLGIIFSLCITYIIFLFVKYNYYKDIILFFNGNNSNTITPISNISNITTHKKEIELTPMKKYIVIQSPNQQFSIGIEVQPLSI